MPGANGEIPGLEDYRPTMPVSLDDLIEVETLATLGRGKRSPDDVRKFAGEIAQSIRRTVRSGQPVAGSEGLLKEDKSAMQALVLRINAVLEGTADGAEKKNGVPEGCVRARVTRSIVGGFIAAPDGGGKGVSVKVDKAGAFKPGQDVVLRVTGKVDDYGHHVAVLVETPNPEARV